MVCAWYGLILDTWQVSSVNTVFPSMDFTFETVHPTYFKNNLVYRFKFLRDFVEDLGSMNFTMSALPLVINTVLVPKYSFTLALIVDQTQFTFPPSSELIYSSQGWAGEPSRPGVRVSAGSQDGQVDLSAGRFLQHGQRFCWWGLRKPASWGPGFYFPNCGCQVKSEGLSDQ